MNLTEEAKEVAQSVVDYHELFDNRFHDQADWVHGSQTGKVKQVENIEVRVCSSSMCAAGTVSFLYSTPTDFRDMSDNDMSEFAGELLGLNEVEANALFLNTGDNEARDILKALGKGDESEAKRLLRKAGA